MWVHASCRPQLHSWCRSVAGGHETRQISVLSIMTQDENESMAESRQKGGFKNLNKTFAGWCKTGGSWNTVQTLAFLLEVGGKGILFVQSAVFWGAMLVFSLLRRGGQMFMFDWKSLSTPGSCGEHSCHDWRPSHGWTTAEEEWQQMTTTT